MPRSYQIIPEGSMFRPKIATYINDNSEVDLSSQSGGGTVTSALFVFASPKGRDREVLTIKNGQTEFLQEFGLGPFSMFGQPLMNAYAAATAASSSNAMIHCLRVTADDATYSTATVVAKYRIEGDTMKLQFVVKPADSEITDLKDLATACTVDGEEDPAGYIPVKLFTLAYAGRGTYGKNIRFRITTDSVTDKLNKYKNYNFSVFRNETILEQAENFSVSFVPDAVSGNNTLFVEDVINDSEDGSILLNMYVDTEGLQALYDAYVSARPDTTFTINDFDPILGIDKYTRQAIPGLEIESSLDVIPSDGETAVDLQSSTGIALMGGSDGALASGAMDRQTILDALYLKAYKGEIDPNIVSKNRFPTTFIYDANFPIETKLAIVALAIKRTDCMAMLDFGLDITTKSSVETYYDANFEGVIDSRVVTLEPYCMKVRDPYNSKAVTVTSTYWLASEYFNHIAGWNGKHRPLAGNRFGIMSGYISNSVYPVFDEDLDASLMDELAEKKCNIAKFNQNQVVVRSMQNTSQNMLSNLTEQNNVLVLLDVKRDCERVAANIEYDFAEPDDIARFNALLSTVTDKYAAAQVRSITAQFGQNTWEAERSIIHLYVAMVHKNLVKTTIIEIDVNRSES